MNKKRRTAENTSHQVWLQVSAWQAAYKDTKITSVSCSLPRQEVQLKDKGRLRHPFAAAGLHLLKAAQKRTLKCEILVYTRLSPDKSLPSCTNSEEAGLKPAINSPSLAADFALKHLHHLHSTSSARNLQPRTLQQWDLAAHTPPQPVWCIPCVEPCRLLPVSLGAAGGPHLPLSSGELYLEGSNKTSSSKPSCTDKKWSLGCGLPWCHAGSLP